MQQASKRSGQGVARVVARLGRRCRPARVGAQRACGIGARVVPGTLIVLLATGIGAPPGAAVRAAAGGAAAPAGPVAASAAASSARVAAAPASRRTDLIGLAPLVPRLTDAERRAMRLEARALRARAAAPSPAWALVAAPSADRRQSERVTARMQAVFGGRSALPRAETMRSGTAWRAVVWPFRDAREAEQARQALAGRGLRTELIEF